MTDRDPMGLHFQFDPKTGSVTGPADYMRDRFDDKVADIKAGRCTVFNYSVAQGHPTRQAVLVALQTDYASFRGMREFDRMREAAS